jgi:hypothetical protein
MADLKDLELRDWFAGHALEGILSNVHYPPQGAGEALDHFAARVTESAYRIAEAMLKYGQSERSAAW